MNFFSILITVCLLWSYQCHATPWDPVIWPYYAIDVSSAEIEIDNSPAYNYSEPLFVVSRKVALDSPHKEPSTDFWEFIPLPLFKEIAASAYSDSLYSATNLDPTRSNRHFFPTLTSDGMTYHKLVIKHDSVSHPSSGKRNHSLHYFLNEDVSLSASPTQSKVQGAGASQRAWEMHFMLNVPID